MDREVSEISSLTSEADLTRIHAQSDLLFEHTSRRTKSGFLVDGPLLQQYIPTPPSKKPFNSWIYEHGEGVTRKTNGQKLWLCRLCYDNKPPKLVLKPCLPTTTPIRHLVQEHGFEEDGTKVNKPKRKRRDSQEDLPTTVQRQIEAQSAVFDSNDWKAAYLSWAIADDVSLSKTASKRLRRLLGYRAPLIKPIIPKSRNTTRRWIIEAYNSFKAVVIHHLSTAKSRISLSFDAWKSDNELDLLGVVAHFLDEQYEVKNVLLALRNTYGSHTAEELKHHLLTVVREYRITTRIAFFMADSAPNNDPALELLQSDLDIDPVAQRLRCACHVINLVCKAILYGCDIDCIDNALSDEAIHSGVAQFEQILRSKDKLAKLGAWRKKGPIGKLHNIVIHARATPARREYFKSKQRRHNLMLSAFTNLLSMEV